MSLLDLAVLGFAPKEDVHDMFKENVLTAPSQPSMMMKKSDADGVNTFNDSSDKPILVLPAITALDEQLVAKNISKSSDNPIKEIHVFAPAGNDIL